MFYIFLDVQFPLSLYLIQIHDWFIPFYSFVLCTCDLHIQKGCSLVTSFSGAPPRNSNNASVQKRWHIGGNELNGFAVISSRLQGTQRDCLTSSSISWMGIPEVTHSLIGVWQVMSLASPAAKTIKIHGTSWCHFWHHFSQRDIQYPCCTEWSIMGLQLHTFVLVAACIDYSQEFWLWIKQASKQLTPLGVTYVKL